MGIMNSIRETAVALTATALTFIISPAHADTPAAPQQGTAVETPKSQFPKPETEKQKAAREQRAIDKMNFAIKYAPTRDPDQTPTRHAVKHKPHHPTHAKPVHPKQSPKKHGVKQAAKHEK